MRKTSLAATLAAALFALPAAHAQQAGGFFINASLGQSRLDQHAYDASDTGFGANLGYRWALGPQLLLGVEAGYADLGSFAPRAGFPQVPYRKAAVDGWSLGVNAHANLTENWYVAARTGWFRADMQGSRIVAQDTTFGGASVLVTNSASGTSNQWYAGVGFGYDFSNHVSVGLNYDHYRSDRMRVSIDPSLVSVSAEYRF